MPKKWQLHWSHLSMLWRCGEQYRRRYLEGDIVPPGAALIVGSATHAPINVDMLRKIDTGELADAEELADIARDTVTHHFDDGNYWIPPAERKDTNTETLRAECVETAQALSALHHEELAPKIEPVHAERLWVVEIPGFPCDLSGQIDIQTAHAIRDVKTKKQSPSKSLAEDSDQLTMYALAAKVLDGEFPEVVWMDYLVKTKTPKIVSLDSVRDGEDAKVLLERIAVSVKAIEAGNFLPADQSEWVCSSRWCGYHETCKYVRGRKVVQIP